MIPASGRREPVCREPLRRGAAARGVARPVTAAPFVPTMAMRVAMLAAECEPWAKTGGLADVVDALARALGAEAGGRLEHRWTCSCRATGASRRPTTISGRPRSGVPDPRSPSGSSAVTIVDVPATATGSGWWTIPPHSTGTLLRRRRRDYPDNAWRFALFCRAALDALRRDGTPLDVLHVHDWHTGPAASSATPATRRPGRWRRGGPGHPAQPRLPRLAPARRSACSGWRRGTRRRPTRPGWTSCSPPSSGRTSPTPCRRASPRGADARLRDGLEATLRAKGDRFISILNGLDRRLGPGDRRGLAAPYCARIRPARLPAARTCWRSGSTRMTRVSSG